MQTEIIGHSANIELLGKMIKAKNPHQSFLFSGPEYVGKYTLSRAFASNLINEREECLWNTSVTDDLDLQVVAPEEVEQKKKKVIKDISIEAIKDATTWLALAPDKNAKVLIINDAHRMTVSAQNALLKTLEEPKDMRYIILVSHSPDSLLQTVLSRCFVMQFSTVAHSEIESCFGENEYLDDCGGRPGFLTRIQNDENMQATVEYARDRLQKLAGTKLHERMELAEELSKKDDEYLQIFLHVWIYRIWRAAHKTQKLSLLKLADRVDETLKLLQNSNANKQLVLENLFINIV